MAPTRTGEWTLTEAARLLDVPQHRLIYLCEKEVVQPDLHDAEGRGSSRRFSDRNLLEFAVALTLRDLDLPAELVGSVIYVFRAFERSVASEVADFRLPGSLRAPSAPDLRVIISDGQRLYFSLRTSAREPKLFGGVPIPDRNLSAKARRALARELGPVEREKRGSAASDAFGGPEGSRHVRLEVSITRIAQDLRLES